MGIYRSEISDLRKNIGENIGQRIIIKESPGKRSKPLEKAAIIENTYKDYFRVKFEEANRVGSYNYTDLFTKTDIGSTVLSWSIGSNISSTWFIVTILAV